MNLYKVSLRGIDSTVTLTRFYVVSDSTVTAGAKALSNLKGAKLKLVVSEVVELLDAELLR